jgi:hypothetical protein
MFLEKLLDFEKLKFNYNNQLQAENFLLRAMAAIGTR